MTERQQQDDGIQGEGAPRGLARQLAALRVGVEGIRDDLDEAGDPPDYTDDLRAIKTTLDAVSGRMAAVETSPALIYTPEDYARLIGAAADKAAVQPGTEVADTVAAFKAATAALGRTIRHQANMTTLGKVALYFLGATAAIVIVLSVIVTAIFG